MTISRTKPSKGKTNTDRPGYNPNFLGFPVPLPTLTPRLSRFVVTGQQLSGPDKTELRYTHFSVVMNKARRLAYFAAVNVDVNAPFKAFRESDESWSFDSRLPVATQAGGEYYEGNPLDRGHLVRRQDAAWGQTKREAAQAALDTFHFTNCTPQHRVFNQSGLATEQHLKLWGNLENYLTRFARLDNKRLCIINGPVFRSTDRLYRGLRIPREFWKVVVFDKGKGQPTAVAFLLSQQNLIADLAEKDLKTGEFKLYQVSLARLERLTKLSFNQQSRGDVLKQRSLALNADEPEDQVGLITSLAHVVV